jgi:hypothetical protein
VEKETPNRQHNHTLRQRLSAGMSWPEIKFWLGRLANLAGYPLLVRPCEYHSANFETSVSVKRLEMYTLITVNGLDVYFNRFTGKIDGLGSTPTSGCTILRANIPELENSGEQCEPVVQQQAHMRRIEDLPGPRRG